MAFTEFPNVVQALLQQGFLVRELEEGLDSVLAYRRLAVIEDFPGRIGETMTRTRKGRKAPVTTPLPTNSNTGLDNGLVPSSFTVEQYTFTLKSYADTTDLNLMQSEANIADDFIANARNNGVQAAQSLERICRQKLFNAYLGGNTRAITQPSASPGSVVPPADGTSRTVTNTNTAANSNTNFNVDDIRGFQVTLVNGVVTPVSGANPLAAVLTKASDGTTVAISITAATAFIFSYSPAATGLAGQQADALSRQLVTSTPDALPGFLTLTSAGYTALNGDTIVAGNAPAILRPFNRLNMTLIQASDVISLGIIEDAVAYLRDNAVPTMDDGTYHCIMDNTSMRQLFADQDFKILYAGRSQSAEYREGDIVRMLGVTFVPTTEAYVQVLGTIKIRRPIVVGAEAIIQGNFEGMMTWLRNLGEQSDSSVAMVDGVVQIVREPLDRLQQVVAQSWTWIGDYAIPTDLTANSSIIPTASSALYKRAVVIEHAG